METAKDWKDKGNALVKEKKYKEALDCYSKAIEIDPNDPILYSNRSLMHINLSEFDQAITDAEKAISIKPEYAKAYLRKGKALEGQQRLQEALDTYKLGLEKDKTNAQLLEASQELEAQLNNPFLKNYAKLFTDPRTAQMMKDPQFRNLIDYALKDQKILMQMIQTDPRFMTVFSVLTGIDLEKMSEDVQKKSEERKREEEKKKKEEEEKRKKEEEEKKKREEEEKYNKMTPEEKLEEEANTKKIELKKEWRSNSLLLPKYKSPIMNIIKKEENEKIKEKCEEKNIKRKNLEKKFNIEIPLPKISEKLRKENLKQNLNLNSLQGVHRVKYIKDELDKIKETVKKEHDIEKKR